MSEREKPNQNYGGWLRSIFYYFFFSSYQTLLKNFVDVIMFFFYFFSKWLPHSVWYINSHYIQKKAATHRIWESFSPSRAPFRNFRIFGKFRSSRSSLYSVRFLSSLYFSTKNTRREEKNCRLCNFSSLKSVQSA
jgi:hypothetical protein